MKLTEKIIEGVFDTLYENDELAKKLDYLPPADMRKLTDRLILNVTKTMERHDVMVFQPAWKLEV